MPAPSKEELDKDMLEFWNQLQQRPARAAVERQRITVETSHTTVTEVIKVPEDKLIVNVSRR